MNRTGASRRLTRVNRFLVVSLAAGLLLAACGGGEEAETGPVRIGGISDLTGFLAFLGQSQKQMVELAVAEINSRGGVLGRQLEVQYVDGASDPATWATRVRDLTGVPLIIGGLTSAERDAIKAFATGNSLYIWPQLTEGEGECEDRMFTTGPVPEQQMVPFVDYLMDDLGARSFYVIGSDYNFPRGVSAIVIPHIEEKGGTVIDEKYFPLDATDFSSLVADVARERPDAIFSNVIPPGAYSLIRQLNEAGLWNDVVYATPGSDEGWLSGVERDQIAGLYSSLDYYESLTDPTTQSIISEYKKANPEGPPITAAGGATGAYRGVQLWAAAVEEAGTTDPAEVEAFLDSATTDRSPGGPVRMVAETRHAAIPTYIGRFTTTGIDVLQPILPVREPTLTSCKQ